MSEEPAVTLTSIDQVYEALASVPQDGSFAVLLFGPNGAPPKPMDALNVQFSVEDGQVGLDWVLLSPDNVAASARVRRFLEDRGVTVRHVEMNDVQYLRVEEEDLVPLCRDLLTEVFSVTTSQEMYLIAEGFDWP